MILGITLLFQISRGNIRDPAGRARPVVAWFRLRNYRHIFEIGQFFLELLHFVKKEQVFHAAHAEEEKRSALILLVHHIMQYAFYRRDPRSYGNKKNRRARFAQL